MYGNVSVIDVSETAQILNEDPVRLEQFEAKIARGEKLNLMIGCPKSIADN